MAENLAQRLVNHCGVGLAAQRISEFPSWKKWIRHCCACDIGFDSAHDMALDPIMLLENFAVLVIERAGETGSRETRGVSGEIAFYTL